MVGFVESAGKTFAPIVELEEGDVICAQVIEVRKETGQFNSDVVDLATEKGLLFSLNGHAILVDKIEQQLAPERDWFRIERKGMVGRAKDYEVSLWDGSIGQLAKDPTGGKLLKATETLIAAKIDATPPSD